MPTARRYPTQEMATVRPRLCDLMPCHLDKKNNLKCRQGRTIVKSRELERHASPIRSLFDRGGMWLVHKDHWWYLHGKVERDE